MLENAIRQPEALGKSFLMGDTTYKLIEGDKFLISPICTQDLDRKTRLVALILS